MTLAALGLFNRGIATRFLREGQRLAVARFCGIGFDVSALMYAFVRQHARDPALRPPPRPVLGGFGTLLGALFLVMALCLRCVAAAPIVSEARIEAANGISKVLLSLDAPVSYHILVLNDPHRVVLDLPFVHWVPEGLSGSQDGIVDGIRHGRFDHDTTRVVLDCRGRPRVRSVALTRIAPDRWQLALGIGPARASGGPADPPSTDARPQRASDVAEPVLIGATGLPQGDVGPPRRPGELAGVPERPSLPQARTLERAMFDTPRARPAGAPRASSPHWVIAVDPGHGGHDPGAIGPDGSYEKRVTLATARALRDELLALRRYKVVLTRDKDVFIELRERIAIARAAGADLFVSLHADKTDNPEIRGLSVYTLSQRASDAEAAALAEKENSVDLVGGVRLRGETAEVTNVLIDMVRRDTMNQSAYLASSLERELAKATQLLPRTHRFAGFAVLKAPDVPSTLIELGYLSNEADRALLLDKRHRQRLAQAIARAIDGYFVSVEAQNRS